MDGWRMDGRRMDGGWMEERLEGEDSEWVLEAGLCLCVSVGPLLRVNLTAVQSSVLT